MHHTLSNHLKLKIETHGEGLNPVLINQQQIFIELEIFPQIRAHSFLMRLADQGLQHNLQSYLKELRRTLHINGL